MSNSIATIQFLKQNPDSHFLRITDMSTDTPLGKKDTYLHDITNQNLQDYIKLLLNGRECEIWIEHRKVQGNTNVKFGQSYKMDFIIKKPTEAVAVIPAAQVPATQSQAINAEPIYNHSLSNPFGLSAPQIMDNMMKANKLDDVKETLKEVKEELVVVKRKNEILDDENRKLKTDLSIAAKDKEMAILAEKLDKKSWIDSPAFEKLMDKAPEMMQGVVAMKMGATTETVTMGLGNPNVSNIKREFFEFIGESCTDEQVNYLGSVVHFIGNESFMLELNNLIQKYANGNIG
jgi:hypothetical protein